MEKDLILDEVTQLSDRLTLQVSDNRNETYVVTKKINDQTKQIKSLTRKTMAKVSELAMYQASSMSLYREKVEKECLLEEGLMRLEKGDIPLEEIEKDFMRAQRTQAQKKDKLQSLQYDPSRFNELYFFYSNDRQTEFYVNGQTKTAAEPRPNAYIPETTLDHLPIPKPYGEYSPFKPQEKSTLLRYYAKPIIKPIEL